MAIAEEWKEMVDRHSQQNINTGTVIAENCFVASVEPYDEDCSLIRFTDYSEGIWDHRMQQAHVICTAKNFNREG